MTPNPITPPEQNEKLYTPGEVAKMVDVSVETLRLYEREGLILPLKLESGHRRYTDADIIWLECIQKQIHDNKLNFAGINYLLSLLPCWDIKPCCLKDKASCPAGVKSCKPCWVFENTPCRVNGEDCRNCPVYQKVMNIDHLKEILTIKFKC